MGKSIPMNMDRLKTDFAGIKMPTPVMGASGTFGFGVEYDDFIDLKQVGAIISKGITPLPRAGNPGVRIAETPAGMLNCIGIKVYRVNRVSNSDGIIHRENLLNITTVTLSTVRNENLVLFNAHTLVVILNNLFN